MVPVCYQTEDGGIKLYTRLRILVWADRRDFIALSRCVPMKRSDCWVKSLLLVLNSLFLKVLSLLIWVGNYLRGGFPGTARMGRKMPAFSRVRLCLDTPESAIAGRQSAKVSGHTRDYSRFAETVGGD